MAVMQKKGRGPEWRADLVETLGFAVAAGALACLALVVAAMVLMWSTSAGAAEEGLSLRVRDEVVPMRVREEIVPMRVRDEIVPMRVRDAQSGTLLFKSNVKGDTFAVSLVDTAVSMRITGSVARVRVVQRFRNPFNDWFEGIYVFPLPENAAVDGLRMRIGERSVDGVIKERDAARASYERARTDGRKAALLEQERPNIFTSSVANIPPGEDIEIAIEYQHTLRYDQGRFTLRFPLVVAPRYMPRDQVADAARIAPPVPHPRELGASKLNPVRLNIELDAGVPIEAVRSRSHEVRVAQAAEGRYSVQLVTDAVPADRDFELEWVPVAAAAPRAALFSEEKNGHTYALLMVLPPVAEHVGTRLPREVVFVIDTSGSMHGTSIAQAKQALLLALKRLAPQDRFNVIEFNSTTTMLFRDALPATPDNVGRAAMWVARLDAQGGTEMAGALSAALKRSDDPSVLRQVVFLTDGAVGNEDALFTLIRERLGDSRLFTVGIGSAPNSYFMTKAAETGGDTFTYIGRVEEVAEKMGALFEKLESPVMKNLRIDWPGAVEAWPRRIPDLYRGEPLVVTARLDKLDGAVRLSGWNGQREWTEQLPLTARTTESGIGKLWARSKIAALADAQREDMPNEEAKARIVAVALEHGLVSKHTSLVAIDAAPARPRNMPLASGDVPVNLPDGMVHEAVFGELPQTATPARLHFVLAVVALVLALSMLLATRRRGHALAG